MQLTYHPAFDTYHAIFRMLRLRELFGSRGQIEETKIRIVDFYLLFPFFIEQMRLKPEHRKFRLLARKHHARKPYGIEPNGKTIFDRMSAVQKAALATLASRQFFDSVLLENGVVAITDRKLSPGLGERIASLNRNEAALLEILAVFANEYDLAGPNGLKARTGLMEFRYDPI